MAPPQVDLSKKQPEPLEDVTGWAEKVGEYKLPPLPATAPSDDVVPVETATRIAGKRMLGKKRCKILTIGIFIGIAVTGAIACGVFFGVRRHHHKEWRGRVEDEGHEADEYIQTDGTKHVIHITRDEYFNFYRLRAVLDYDRQLAAFKDCSKNRCYIDTLHEDYENGCRRWMEYRYHARQPRLRPMRVVNPALEPEVLEYFGGEEIAQVCGSAPAFLVVEMPAPEDSHDSDEIPPPPPGVDVVYL